MRTLLALIATLFTGLTATAPAVPAQEVGTRSEPQQGGAVKPSTEKPLTFDVVSVRPVGPISQGGGRKGGGGGPTGPGTADPGRIHYNAIRLEDLLITAFNVKEFQIVGPDWLKGGWTDSSTRFRIDATLPPDTTREQLLVMLQNMLAERFKLMLHRETRELPKYSLVLGKNGPKLKESAEVPLPKDGAQGGQHGGRRTGSNDAYGFPNWRMPPEGGTWRFFINGRGRIGGERATTQALTNDLADHLRSPVTDDTGLKRKYDFVLAFSLPGWSGPAADLPGGVGTPTSTEAPEPLPDVFGAIQSQLGLKLEPKKGPVEVIVIDHIEKNPTEN